MMLAPLERYLNSCWTGYFNDEEVGEILALPQHVRPVALLAVGKGHPPAVLTGRMAAGEHVHRNIW